MNLKKIFLQAKSSPLIRLYLRLFPTIIGLSIIATFLTTRPEMAQDLTTRFFTKLGIQAPQSTTQAKLDLITPINNLRKDNDISTLDHSALLDNTAKLISLTIADNPDSDEEIDLKQIAGLADYPYSTIAYLAAINPLPLITPPTDLWIRDSREDLIDPEFTQIGSYQLNTNIDNQANIVTVLVLASPQVIDSSTPTVRRVTAPSYYTGTQLWAEIQKYRVEHGVSEFKQDNTLCTIASIRVNQMIELGTLDNHAGFGPLVDQFRDEEKTTHTNIAENILSGYLTPQEAVAGWDGSLGHQALMRDGSYVFACAAANQGYGVLIAAF